MRVVICIVAGVVIALGVACTPDWATPKVDGGADAGQPDALGTGEGGTIEDDSAGGQPDAADASDDQAREGDDAGSGDSDTMDAALNECAPNPCLNGGTCTDGVRSYSCSCAMGFSGDRCETATNWCAQQTRPAAVAASDYRCVDFESGLPASSQWIQQKKGEGSLALSSARAQSAPISMECVVGAESSDQARLSWTAVGGSAIKNMRVSFDLNPTNVQGLREWSGSVDLACLQNATHTFCLSYSRGAYKSGTYLSGYFLRVYYSIGLPLDIGCPISASIPSQVWTRVELAFSDSAAAVLKINGSAVSTADCDFPLGADSNVTMTVGLDVSPSTYDAFTAYFDNVVAYVQR